MVGVALTRGTCTCGPHLNRDKINTPTPVSRLLMSFYETLKFRLIIVIESVVEQMVFQLECIPTHTHTHRETFFICQPSSSFAVLGSFWPAPQHAHTGRGLAPLIEFSPCGWPSIIIQTILPRMDLHTLNIRQAYIQGTNKLKVRFCTSQNRKILMQENVEP